MEPSSSTPTRSTSNGVPSLGTVASPSPSLTSTTPPPSASSSATTSTSASAYIHSISLRHLAIAGPPVPAGSHAVRHPDDFRAQALADASLVAAQIRARAAQFQVPPTHAQERLASSRSSLLPPASLASGPPSLKTRPPVRGQRQEGETPIRSAKPRVVRAKSTQDPTLPRPPPPSSPPPRSPTSSLGSSPPPPPTPPPPLSPTSSLGSSPPQSPGPPRPRRHKAQGQPSRQGRPDAVSAAATGAEGWMGRSSSVLGNGARGSRPTVETNADAGRGGGRGHGHGRGYGHGQGHMLALPADLAAELDQRWGVRLVVSTPEGTQSDSEQRG
ncbi:hypothetical protein GGR56DRAFT_159662 [Xylariaceae sp. FL0804]|nr:hypothetical protein GGR56DRAFT_159662 [Xylariaceae sp. FL0804]